MRAGRLVVLIALTVFGPGAVEHAAVNAAAPANAGLRTGAFDPPPPAPAFAVPGAGGGEFRLSRHRGKVVVLAFGYTSCPDVCPTVLAELTQVRAQLGTAAQRLQVVCVSVDPRGSTT